MNGKFDYIASESYSSFAIIELNDAAGFIKYAEANSVKFIFTIAEKKDNLSAIYFFFNAGNVIYKINSMGYQYLEEYADGVKNGFPSADIYYEARKKGCNTFSEYDNLQKLDIKKMDDFYVAQKNGFVKGFEEFKQKLPNYKERDTTSGIPDDLNNPILLMEYAREKGFTTYKDFERVYDLGFQDIYIYKEALSKGFKNSYDFYTALKAGFYDCREYEEAKKLFITSKQDYDNYKYFKINCPKEMGHDEYQLIGILQKQENGSKLKVDKIRELLNEDQKGYKISLKENEKLLLPIWYFQKIAKNETMVQFLKTNEQVKQNGFYYDEKNYFEVFRISNAKVYIDASNVSRYNCKENIGKFKQLKIIVDELRGKGFTDITAIADATLRHIVVDPEILQVLKKDITYCEAPSHTSADEFLLENARKEKCLIISNDTFNDWKIKDKWIAHNIDNIRIPFLFTDGKVTMPGLNRIVNGKN